MRTETLARRVALRYAATACDKKKLAELYKKDLQHERTVEDLAMQYQRYAAASFTCYITEVERNDLLRAIDEIDHEGVDLFKKAQKDARSRITNIDWYEVLTDDIFFMALQDKTLEKLKVACPQMRKSLERIEKWWAPKKRTPKPRVRIPRGANPTERQQLYAAAYLRMYKVILKDKKVYEKILANSTIIVVPKSYKAGCFKLVFADNMTPYDRAENAEEIKRVLPDLTRDANLLKNSGFGYVCRKPIIIVKSSKVGAHFMFYDKGYLHMLPGIGRKYTRTEFLRSAADFVYESNKKVAQDIYDALQNKTPPYEVGDVFDVKGHTYKIMEIGPKNTRIRRLDYTDEEKLAWIKEHQSAFPLTLWGRYDEQLRLLNRNPARMADTTIPNALITLNMGDNDPVGFISPRATQGPLENFEEMFRLYCQGDLPPTLSVIFEDAIF